jgi:prepilin-type N-terminal cleavage/methylation domain-containing protein
MKRSSEPRSPAGRRGFTITETMVALGILGVVLLLLAQLAILVLRERQRSEAHQDALEAAANVLEAARACPWDDLTPAWAARQRLPEPVAGRLPDGRLEVRVEPEQSRPHTRRVTVEVRWSLGDDRPAQSVSLVGLRSARSAPATGGQP